MDKQTAVYSANGIIFNTKNTLNIEKAYLTGYDLTLYIPGLGNVDTFQYFEESNFRKACRYDRGKPQGDESRR